MQQAIAARRQEEKSEPRSTERTVKGCVDSEGISMKDELVGHELELSCLSRTCIDGRIGSKGWRAW